MGNRVCLQCGKPLKGFLRLFGERRFCSTEHQKRHQEEMERLALESLSRAEQAAKQMLARRRAVVEPVAPPKNAEPSEPAMAPPMVESYKPSIQGSRELTFRKQGIFEFVVSFGNTLSLSTGEPPLQTPALTVQSMVGLQQPISARPTEGTNNVSQTTLEDFGVRSGALPSMADACDETAPDVAGLVSLPPVRFKEASTPANISDPSADIGNTEGLTIPSRQAEARPFEPPSVPCRDVEIECERVSEIQRSLSFRPLTEPTPGIFVPQIRAVTLRPSIAFLARPYGQPPRVEPEVRHGSVVPISRVRPTGQTVVARKAERQAVNQ